MVRKEYRKHKIHLEEAVGYYLALNDSEEVAFYNKIREEMKDDKRNGNMEITREAICSNSFLLTMFNHCRTGLT